MADDDNNLEVLLAEVLGDDAEANAGVTNGAELESHRASVSSVEDADEAQFADLIAGPGDLFSYAVERMRREAETAHQDRVDIDDPLEATLPGAEFRTDDERAAFALLSELAYQPGTIVDETVRAESHADAGTIGADLWRQGTSPRERRLQRDRREEREIVAEALVRQLGAAGEDAALAVRERYLKLPRLQQAALIALSGDERSARRAAASTIVRAMPTLAERLLNWMEEPDSNKAELEGLALAAILDEHALTADEPFLSALATEVLLVSLRTPLIRIVDLSPSRMNATVQTWAAPLAARQVTSARLATNFNAPQPAEALSQLKLLSAGIAPLPFAEGRLTLTEPARRVAVALAKTIQDTDVLWRTDCHFGEINAQMENVLLGIGLLLAGVASNKSSSDRNLVRAASNLGQQHLRAATTKIKRDYQGRIDAAQRRRASEKKAHQQDIDAMFLQLADARKALANLGLDETGRPFNEIGRADADPVHLQPSNTIAIVCPKLDLKGNSKTKEAVLGHEHMLGAELPLVPVGDLPAIRRHLISEFPWATDVVDFILGDLLSRTAVTIRPVLLTGTPGSGKSHFVRRFAYCFGLHLWSVDCGGSDGAVFAGTDRRWHSAEPSHPFLAMSRGRQANPLIMLDEIEKTPTRSDNGRLWDALLPFLDPGSNASVQDRCLQVPIDASHVNYIATANSIDPLPWPLRDRLRIIGFPEPKREHLVALIPPLLSQLASARGLDARFIEPLTSEDHAFLHAHWHGGSVRRLARLIEAIVNARDRNSLRH